MISPAGGGNGWAAVVVRSSDRYDQCGTSSLKTIEIATRRPGRVATQNGCEGIPLSEQTVVTASGAPAWIVPGAPSLLMSIDAAGRFARLDSGAIAELRTEGDEVVWTNGGEPRRARP